MIRRVALVAVGVASACAAFPTSPASTAETIAQAFAPLLPALVANYDANGRACIAAATSRAEADGCLAELRQASRVWAALEPFRFALDQLAEIELSYQEDIARRWPDPLPPAACALPDAGAPTPKDAAP